MKYDIAIIGLGVMGQSLARNMAHHGIKVLGWDRHEEKGREFIQKYGNDHLGFCESFEEFPSLLNSPAKYLMLVPAGGAVDEVLASLSPFLKRGDIVIDAGNSLYSDTIRRTQALEEKRIHFVGMGVSGGEEGALHGPSLMPGGSQESWTILKPLLEKIAAKDFAGQPCVSHMGQNGAGHYVKMVHNGIEYGVMQMIAEAYFLLKNLYHLSSPELANLFKELGQGPLKSFLFDICVPILEKKDELTDGFLIDHILDKAGQKGTGGWTAIEAVERGISLPTITAAVFARNVSAEKENRQKLAHSFPKADNKVIPDLETFKKALGKALYAGMISTYAQGFHLMKKAAEEQGWEFDFAEISRIWQGGCIIRAELLKELHQALKSKTDHLFFIENIQKTLERNLEAWRKVVSLAMESGIPVPALSSSLIYFEEMTTDPLSANFIQGLRDYFGAHTYERTDRQGSFHTQWSE